MRDQRSRYDASDLTTARQERATQQAVLVVVIDLHPVHVTISELVRQMARHPEDVVERDDIERAALDLAGVGLLHHHDFLHRPDALVAPTQAALVANDLLLDEEEKDEE